MRQRLFGLAAILLAASGVSAYAECVRPPPLADVTTKVDTEGAVGKVLTIAGISLKADIEVERKSIFTQFPNANQMVVALVAIYQYCTQLEAVKTLTDEQKLEKLAAYQTNSGQKRRGRARQAAQRRKTVRLDAQRRAGVARRHG